MSPDVIWNKSFKMYRKIILFIIIITISATSGDNIFKTGKKYEYSYFAESNSGVLSPSKAASSWGMQGKFVVKTSNSIAEMQLTDLKSFIWNGEYVEEPNLVEVKDQAADLLKPFQIIYSNGTVTNFSVEIEPIWAINIQRSIASIFQFDLNILQKEVAFHSQEDSHYGRCNIENIVTIESDNELWIRKYFDPRTCTGHPHWTWTNVPRMQCPTGDESPIIKSSERLYKVKLDGNDTEITFINATGGIYVQPFKNMYESQFLFTRQIFKLIDVTDFNGDLSNGKLRQVSLQHELPDNDLSQERFTHEKEHIFKSISILLDRLSQRLENPGLDTEINNLHNTTISILLYYFSKFDRIDLQTAYNNISGTSYKEETIRNMFLELVPQIGTRDSALFVMDLIQQKKVSDITAMQLLTQLPFHIRKPDVEFLDKMKTLIDLPEKLSTEVRNTGILTFGTLIYKTCLVYCPDEVLDDYVRLYMDKFTESDSYDRKMIWLEGLANIQLGKVVEFLEPIATGNNEESRHLRVLAAWASLPTAPYRPDIIYRAYWPILANRTEYLEMRIAALQLLIESNPTSNRIISLYWYMQGESDLHLVNYFYTTLKSMERTNFPCYKHIGSVATQFSRILKKPESDEHIITGNYIFDYQDMKRNFGAMVQNIIIASPLSNIPEIAYITLNSHGSGTHFNQISLQIKATGLTHSLSHYLESFVRIKDILKEFKLDDRSFESPHIEIIARVQQKAVLCLHFNKTNIDSALSYLRSLPENTFQIYQNMEFHINQQRINIPLTMESIQVTDLGTNVRLAATANSLFSMRGNFTYLFNGRNNHVILRTVIHGTEVVETYNPLIDVWHSAERSQSIHGYLPTNVTVGLQEKLFLSYNTPTEYLQTGITAHARTVTSVRGVKAAQKLKAICQHCSSLYTVKRYQHEELQNAVVFNSVVPELGGQLEVKVFDCDREIAQDELFNDIWSSHRSNYQTWSGAKLLLLGIHFLDYFSYVPPRGSCGVAIYIEPSNIQPSEVKFEFAKSGKNFVLSLTRSELGSLKVLQQWNLAALYESKTWVSDSLKIKASRTVPGEKVMKICVEIERIMPWTWDYFSLKPSDQASINLNIIWGLSETAKGKCSGSSLLLNMVGEVSKDQIEESKKDKWPYNQCRKQSSGKSVVPYTEACYQASRELSTLRKYQVFVKSENLPEKMENFIWRLRALYDVIGGNSSYLSDAEKFVIGATFPKDSTRAEMRVNRSKLPIKYDPDIVDMILTRTRLHRYIDNAFLRAFFSFCVLTPDMVQSAHNVTRKLQKGREFLVLGQCYDENPGFALTATSSDEGVTLNINDDSNNIKIVPDNGGTVYNFTDQIQLTRDFEWNLVNDKRFRLDKNSIHILLSNNIPFIHFTKDQILIFFPNYIQEFTCGVCTARRFDKFGLYDKI
ncbi:uncharacterized protein LOC130666240 [Microplitis mediator]|uniref:uncharacterized protein LOC130666240 n=1 Tax=Microplitis mediator TaxID=375433 RepID=UPI002554E5D5|nr:uncharacterized protein LOC130666240 [Microplitis mediator]